MRRFLTLLTAAATSIGLAMASTSAIAQKADAAKAADKAVAADKAKADAAPKKPVAAAEASKGEPIDINSASEKELAKLPGIGTERAKAIAKNRPYKGKDDLVSRKIVPESVYKKISDKIVAKQA